jgi:nucleoside 2-deoxyribosyltransferase
MKTKIYLAASLSRAPEVRAIAGMLCPEFEVTYPWFELGPTPALPEARQTTAKDEMCGVLAADYVFVLLAPGQAQRGTHCAMGAAIAAGKKVVVITPSQGAFEADGKPCVFYYHPGVRRLLVEDKATKIANAIRIVVSHDQLQFDLYGRTV